MPIKIIKCYCCKSGLPLNWGSIEITSTGVDLFKSLCRYTDAAYEKNYKIKNCRRTYNDYLEITSS